MQAVIKAPRKPVASLNDRKRTTDRLWEAAVPVMICSVDIDLQKQDILLFLAPPKRTVRQ